MKKFKVNELLSKEDMKKVEGSGHCGNYPCGPYQAGICQMDWSRGGCWCVTIWVSFQC